MRFFTVAVLLFAIVAAVAALPNKPAYIFDRWCYSLHTDTNGDPTFETTEYTDCTPRGNLVCNSQTEICCPKKTGGSKCVKTADLEKVKNQ